MSTVIIVDSACELPEQLANSRSIKTLPLNILLGEQPIRDELSGAQTLDFVREGRLNPKVVSSSDAASPEQIAKFLKREIIPHYNYAIVQTVSSKRSDQYDHWQQVIRKLGQLRQESGKDTFGMTVMDTGTAFSGQALVALETVRLARARLSRRELIHKVKDFIPFLQAYTAPADLGYLRRRAVQRGDSTVSLLNTLIAKALRISPVLFGMNNDLGLSARVKGHENAIGRIIEHAIEAIHRGLRSPLITVSYAGPSMNSKSNQGSTNSSSLQKRRAASYSPVPPDYPAPSTSAPATSEWPWLRKIPTSSSRTRTRGDQPTG